MNTFWPLLLFFAALTLWFAYDGWLNPDTAHWSAFNRLGTLVLYVPTVLAGWLTFRNESSLLPSRQSGASFAGEAVFKAAPPLPRWNWGAFLLTPFWGLGHKVYWGPLSPIPVAGIAVSVVAGVKGYQLAWRNLQWRDSSHFRRIQRIWAWWGFVLSSLGVLMGVTHYLSAAA